MGESDFSAYRNCGLCWAAPTVSNPQHFFHQRQRKQDEGWSMRYWLGLFGIFALMIVAALFISRRTRPDTMEGRFSKVQPGMTKDQATSLMDGEFRPSILFGEEGIRPSEKDYLEWREGYYDGIRVRPKHFRVYFD